MSVDTTTSNPPIGVLVVAHSHLAEALVHVLTHVMGKAPPALAWMAVSLLDQPCATTTTTLQRKIKAVDSGRGVLVLNDLLGATPCNLLREHVVAGRVEVVSGVNVPMLIRAVTYRHLPMDQLLDRVLETAQSAIRRLDPPSCG